MKCKVCGKRLDLKAENRYEIREVPKGLRMLVEDAKVYEAFDLADIELSKESKTFEEM